MTDECAPSAKGDYGVKCGNPQPKRFPDDPWLGEGSDNRVNALVRHHSSENQGKPHDKEVFLRHCHDVSNKNRTTRDIIIACFASVSTLLHVIPHH